MEDTQMTDPQPVYQQSLESQWLPQVIADLKALHERFDTLPNDVAALLRSGEEVSLHHIPTEDKTRLKNLERQLEDLHSQNATLIGEKERMKSVAEAAQRDQGGLRSEIKRQEAVHAQQKRMLQGKEQEIHTLRAEMDQLRQKESALRTIILDKAGTQKVSDQEITSKFANLRRRIDTIARFPIYQMEHVPVLSHKTNDKEQFAFFDEKFWGGLSPDERRNRVISKIFDSINYNILDFRLFGAEGLGRLDSGGKSTGEPLAPGLRHVERVLEAQGVPANMISSWRILTIDCFERLRPQVPHVANMVAKELYNFFGPLLIKSAQRDQEDDLWAKLLELCTEAFDLRMVMRRSTDRYTCEVPGFGGWSMFASKCEELAVTLAVEGGRPSQASDEIAYTLFGGLVKQSAEYGDGKKKVLEKALVILRKK